MQSQMIACIDFRPRDVYKNGVFLCRSARNVIFFLFSNTCRRLIHAKIMEGQLCTNV